MIRTIQRSVVQTDCGSGSSLSGVLLLRLTSRRLPRGPNLGPLKGRRGVLVVARVGTELLSRERFGVERGSV